MAINLLNPACDTCNECGCLEVDTVTIDSSQPCMVHFAATYDLTWPPFFINNWNCPENCPESIYTQLGGGVEACTISGTTYDSYSYEIFAFATADGHIHVAVQFRWRVGLTDYWVSGRFESTDGGATFGSFVVDEFPTGCDAVNHATNMPIDTSDFSCAVTLV